MLMRSLAKRAAPQRLEEHQLANNEVLHLLRMRGCRITSIDGAVWITEEGKLTDTFLQAGEQHVVQSGRLVLVSALTTASVLLDAPYYWLRWISETLTRRPVATVRPARSFVFIEVSSTRFEF